MENVENSETNVRSTCTEQENETEHSDEYETDNEDFYFESDHLALRGNADYRAVLRTIVILEAQRVEAAKDIDRLAEAEKDALDNPEEFIKKLGAGDGLNLPGQINIQNLPKIKFEKYNVSMPASDGEQCSSAKGAEANDLIVRGRLFDQSKPETFNQLWTCEEQRRLEELLIEYPPEAIEMRRYAKIARALGNRTSRQVASRLQKYFQKLHAAGLPVPGRIPRSSRSYVSSVKKHRITKQSIRPTTFFPSNFVPVNITDDDGTLGPDFYRNSCENNDENSNFVSQQDDEDESDKVIVDEPSDSETSTDVTKEMAMMHLLKRVKRDKEKRYPIELLLSVHDGYKCDLCNEDPISGTRWHCTSCRDDAPDFCSDCLITQLQSESPHPFDHKFVGVRVSTELRGPSDDESTAAVGDSDDNDEESRFAEEDTDSNNFEKYPSNVYDKDYDSKCFFKTENKYNYLDPNFLPE